MKGGRGEGYYNRGWVDSTSRGVVHLGRYPLDRSGPFIGTVATAGGAVPFQTHPDCFPSDVSTELLHREAFIVFNKLSYPAGVRMVGEIGPRDTGHCAPFDQSSSVYFHNNRPA